MRCTQLLTLAAGATAFAPPLSGLRAPRAVLRAEAAAASEAEAPKTYKVIDIPSDKCAAV